MLRARLGPGGYEEIGRTKLIEPTTLFAGRRTVWAAPAYARQNVYARNDKELICVSLAERSYPRANDAVLEGGRLRIGFSFETGGIVHVVNTETRHEFISVSTDKPKLWHLAIRRTNDKPVELRSEDCARPLIKLEKASAELVWKGVGVEDVEGSFDVRVTCRILESDQLAHFHIDVDNHSNGSILSAVFPEISGLGTSGKSDVALPKFNWGELFKGVTNALVGYYPAADMPMQFYCLSDQGDSLYLAAHDPGALYKIFRVHPGKVCSVQTSVPDATVAGNHWHAPFDVVLGAYEGDWMASCKLYRKWALQAAPWTARGPIAVRKDVSRAVKEVGVWLNLSENYAENTKNAVTFRKHMDVPVGVHWYNWHSNPFDRGYPDYLPAKPGFVETVRRLKESDIYSMPYINGRLWDTQNTNYFSARRYATSSEAGNPTLEDYQSGTKLAVMCLGHPFWQTNLTSLIRQVVQDTAVGGIYIDQVAGSPITECYNASHGHTLGRDRWWIDGYRKAIGAARNECAKQPEGFFVAAENNAEPYMDFIDLFLIWIPRSENDIPMMTAVYSGYTQYFGTNRGSDSDMSFAMLQARDFTWGAQLFWEGAFILGQGQEEKLKILRNLARLRYRAREYMVEGELVEVVKPKNNVPTVSGKWGSWTSTLENRTVPAVHGTLWKALDGSYAVALANADAMEEAFEFEFAPAQSSDKKWRVQKMTPTGLEELGTVRKGADSLMVNVPSRDGMVLVVR